MQSNDMATWSPVTSLGNSYGAGEIATIIKEGVAYICYRTFSNGTKWLIYNLEDNNITSEGSFNECKNVQSKPDTFTFRNDVYMAVNVYPSIYGNHFNYDPYTVRQEINIYKMGNKSRGTSYKKDEISNYSEKIEEHDKIQNLKYSKNKKGKNMDIKEYSQKEYSESKNNNSSYDEKSMDSDQNKKSKKNKKDKSIKSRL